jgi:DNA-binding MarR family transcriptional regulator
MPKSSPGSQAADVIASECIAVRLRALNRAISGLYDDALRPHGLRVGQLNLLVAVAHLGNAKASDLCGALHMEKSTLSRDTEVMRRNGWLEFGEKVGRVRPLQVTRAGRALLERILPHWRRAHQQAQELLGKDGTAAIVQMVRRLGPENAPGL